MPFAAHAAMPQDLNPEGFRPGNIIHDHGWNSLYDYSMLNSNLFVEIPTAQAHEQLKRRLVYASEDPDDLLATRSDSVWTRDGTNSVYNPDVWFQHRDLTCVNIYHDGQWEKISRQAVLLSPRHAIASYHYIPGGNGMDPNSMIGDGLRWTYSVLGGTTDPGMIRKVNNTTNSPSIYWMDLDGRIQRSRFSHYAFVRNDIVVLYLTEPIDTNRIAVAHFLPKEYIESFPGGYPRDIPGITLSSTLAAKAPDFRHQYWNLGIIRGGGSYAFTATDGQGINTWSRRSDLVRGSPEGDSSCPTFMYNGTNLFITAHASQGGSTSVSGTPYWEVYDEIQTAMDRLSLINHQVDARRYTMDIRPLRWDPSKSLKCWDVMVSITNANQRFTWDLHSGSNILLKVDYDADRGPATVATYTATGLKSHTYSEPGIYRVRLRGDLGGGGNIRFGHEPGTTPELVISTDPAGGVLGISDFDYTFYETALSGLPGDMFREYPQVTSFNHTFQGCRELSELPAGLFNCNTNAVSFRSTFRECRRLVMNPWIFYGGIRDYDVQRITEVPLGTDAFTHFAGRTIDFENFHRIDGMYQGAVPGSAPDLWLAEGDFIHTDTMFAGHGTNSLSNWPDIPEAGYGGPLKAPDYWELVIHLEQSDLERGFSWSIQRGDAVDLQVIYDTEHDPTNIVTYTSPGIKTHHYPSAGDYRVRIRGDLGGDGNIRFGGESDPADFECYLFSGGGKYESLFVEQKDLQYPLGTRNKVFRIYRRTGEPRDWFLWRDVENGRWNQGQVVGGNAVAYSEDDRITGRYLAAASGSVNEAYEVASAAPDIPGLSIYTTPAVVQESKEIGGILGIADFENTFYNCINLSSVPEYLFRWNPQVAENAFAAAFYGCESLQFLESGFGNAGRIFPRNLFRFNILASRDAFRSTFERFRNQDQWIAGQHRFLIPRYFFSSNTRVSGGGFEKTFKNARVVHSMPGDLFKNNTRLGDRAFYETFWNNSLSLILPNDFFRYTTNVSGEAFVGTFGYTGARPSPDLFKYNPRVTSFEATFEGLQSAAHIPDGLFKYNTNAVCFRRTFYTDAAPVYLNGNIFWDDEGDLTPENRFAGQVVDVDEFAASGSREFALRPGYRDEVMVISPYRIRVEVDGRASVDLYYDTDRYLGNDYRRREWSRENLRVGFVYDYENPEKTGWQIIYDSKPIAYNKSLDALEPPRTGWIDYASRREPADLTISYRSTIPTDAYRLKHVGTVAEDYEYYYRSPYSVPGNLRFNTETDRWELESRSYGSFHAEIDPAAEFKFIPQRAAWYKTETGEAYNFRTVLLQAEDTVNDPLKKDAPELWNAAGEFTHSSRAFATPEGFGESRFTNWLRIPSDWGGP